MVLLDHGHAGDLLGAVDRDAEDAMRCPQCGESRFVIEIPHAPTWVRRNGREWRCTSCEYIWPRKAEVVAL